MTLCSKCHIDRDLCPCVIPTQEPIEMYLRLKLYHEKQAAYYAKMIRDEVKKKRKP